MKSPNSKRPNLKEILNLNLGNWAFAGFGLFLAFGIFALASRTDRPASYEAEASFGVLDPS
jgi:hypothetical protein